jgi:hypothetical protein
MTRSHTLSAASLAALCLSCAMASAAVAAGTRDMPLHGPNGDGGSNEACAATDAAPTPATAAQAADAKATKPPAKAPPATRIKAIVPVRSGGDDSSLHAPRWHSFLPGMFR